MEQTDKQVTITEKDKPHSYEFGKAQSRHKIYYNHVHELKAHILALKEAGFVEEEMVS